MSAGQRVGRNRYAGGGDSADSCNGELIDVFRAEYEQLIRMAYVLTGCQEEAEELVQEAFLALRVRWNKVLNPAGYLRSVIANGAKRNGRQAANRRRIVDANADHISPQAFGSPVSDLYLTDVLARISHRKRVAIVLAYFGGFNSNEIAEAMNCRPSTARSLVRRGLQQLKKELERE